MREYIYLIQVREFVKSNEDIYKIGKSKQENLKRFNSYPNGSKLLMQCICSNCNKIERNIIKLFREKYELQKDIGHEYFKGNYKDMIKDINECINNFVEEEVDVDEVVKNEVDENEKIVIYKCDYCDYTADRKYYVTLHSNIKHSDDVNNIYKCNKCDKKLSSKQYLIKHKESCKGIKNILECQKCNKVFFSSSNICRHSKTCKNKSTL